MTNQPPENDNGSIDLVAGVPPEVPSEARDADAMPKRLLERLEMALREARADCGGMPLFAVEKQLADRLGVALPGVWFTAEGIRSDYVNLNQVRCDGLIQVHPRDRLGLLLQDVGEAPGIGTGVDNVAVERHHIVANMVLDDGTKWKSWKSKSQQAWRSHTTC